MKQDLAKKLLASAGWTVEGVAPAAKKYVFIAAPHTSNWDFPLMMAAAVAFGMDIHWFGKQQLFDGPMGPLYRALGGIPVDRSKTSNMVDRMAELFSTRDELALVVPAEGTRGKKEYWKSGFYHMARTAKVPIVCGYLDYARKRGGFGHAFEPSGDVARDMDGVRAFYADKVGKYPECFGPVRLRDESMSADHAGV